MKRGCLITLEGGEGVGKSTQIAYVRDLLIELGHSVVTTREPGGTALAEHIRTLLKSEDMGADAELLLIFAARSDHLEKVLKPALSQGKWVICDRFTDATYAYQGVGRGIGSGRIETLENWVQGEIRPDLTLLLDAPVELGFDRVKKRGEDHDRFERESIDFFLRIREAYLERASLHRDRVHIIDATRPVDLVSADIHAAIYRLHEQTLKHNLRS